MTQDRPTARELLDAVAEFLTEEASPALDGRRAFLARVASNAVAIVARELALGPAADDAESERLRTLLGSKGPLDALNAELARRIRDGSLDARREDVVTHLRETVRDKLRIANPRYLQS